MNDIKLRSDRWHKIALGDEQAKQLVDKGWSRRIADADTIEQRNAIEHCRRVYQEFNP